MLTQFVAAFDDIVIGRFNRDRVEQDRISVRYVYAPKQRVLYDLVNENKTLTLPVVSVNVNNISRDQNRVFNKLDGFYYQGNVGEEMVSRHIKAPVPVNISLSVSILTRYQTDMDQILSNFVPFCNPYVVISWKVPEKFELSVDQEIRSEVFWTGDVNMDYPTELVGNQKARVTADTNFTIKGWLFKDTDNPSGNIFFIDTNFHNETELEYYDNYESLSGNTYTYPASAGLDDRIESFELSGCPTITDILYNGVLLQDDLIVTPNTSGNITLHGVGFTNTETVLFSSDNESTYSNLTAVSNFERGSSTLSGQVIPFKILNDNTITFNSPSLSAGRVRFIPLNKVGFDFSDLSYMDTLCGRGLSSTFLIYKDIIPPQIDLDIPDSSDSKNIYINDSTQYSDISGNIVAVDTINGNEYPVTFSIFSDQPDLSTFFHETHTSCSGEVTVTTTAKTLEDINNTADGTYVVTYSAVDDNGNVGTNEVIVVVDNVPPVVTLRGPDPTIVDNETYIELGATAVDDVDGLLPVTIGGDTVNSNVLGTYNVSYSAVDRAGNLGTNSRIVNVIDTVPPVVTLNGDAINVVESSSTYSELCATAEDAFDGTLPVIVSGDTVDTNTLGTYTISYAATDFSGNVGTATRLVNVIDNTPPVVTLNGSDIISVDNFDSYNELGATAVDNIDGTLPVIIYGDIVNTDVVGTYTVRYYAVDSSGNVGTNTRTVNVLDITPPVVILNGPNPADFEVNTGYTEYGATAIDNVDRFLPVTIGGDTITIDALNTFTKTYSATDSSGNVGKTDRIVNIVDTIAPVVTLNGSNAVQIQALGTYTELSATALDSFEGVKPVFISGDTVDTLVLGSYNVVYTATDSSGNVGTANRTVDVIDNINPVVTVIGDNPMQVEALSNYSELCATAVDSFEGSLPVFISGQDPNIYALGEYTVIYTATDSSGNVGTANRIVNIVDTTPPIVTLNGDSVLTIGINDIYTEQGATAQDNFDGELPVVVGGDTVDTNISVSASYTVSYSATDFSGNVGKADRIVNVVDDILPIVTVTGDNPLEVEAKTAYVELCATAVDNVDGILPVFVYNNTINMDVVNTYGVSYSAIDRAGNIGTATRSVSVIDTIPPVVTLNGSDPLIVEALNNYVELNATALDNVDGVLPVQVGGNIVNKNVLGEYTVIYTATDFSGNVGTNTRTVSVIDTIPPIVTITGDNPMHVEAGTNYSEQGATAQDNFDGVVPVTIGGDTVDAYTLGTYTVSYSATDSSGNVGTADRIVNVADTLPPVVTLNGSDPINITVESEYTELSATAYDSFEGVKPVFISGDTVDVNTDGTYNIIYTATDSSGNVGTNTRQVIVDKPVIQCGLNNSYSGNQGTFTWPIELGSSTGGTVTLDFTAYSIPDRFTVTHGGVVVIDTNYRGTFTDSHVNQLNDILGAGNWSQGGGGYGSASFTKTSSESQAIVTVYGPLPGTAYNFTLNCPV